MAPLGVFFMFLGSAVLIDRLLAESSVQPVHITGLGIAYAVFGALALALARRSPRNTAPQLACPRCRAPIAGR